MPFVHQRKKKNFSSKLNRIVIIIMIAKKKGDKIDHSL